MPNMSGLRLLKKKINKNKKKIKKSKTAGEQAKHRLQLGSYSGMAGDSYIIT